MRERKFRIVSLLLALMLSLSACAVFEGSDNKENETKSQKGNNEKQSTEIAETTTVSQENAIRRNVEELEEKVDEYNVGLADYDAILNELNEIRMEITKLNDVDEKKELREQLNTISELLNTLRISKEKYVYAQEYLKNDDLSLAISALKNVSEIDSNYPDAQIILEGTRVKYIEVITNRVNDYLAENNFELAKDVCVKAKQVEDLSVFDELLASVTDAEKQYNDAIISAKLTEAEYAVASGDYIGAMQIYSQLYTDTSDELYLTKINETQTVWTNACIAKAEELLSKGEYDQAEGALYAAYYNVNDTEIARLNAEIQRIDSFRPFVVDEKWLENYLSYNDSGSNVGFSCWKDITDNLGNKHTGLTYRRKTYSKPGYSKIEYVLYGEYDYIKGSFFLSQDYRDASCHCWLSIYGDGKLLYQSDSLTQGVLPIDVNVNLSGVYRMVIEFRDDDEIGDYHIMCGFTDIVFGINYKPME